jgi:tRNA 2-selenouridine synthase
LPQPVLVESESRAIGKVILPTQFKQKMTTSKVIVVNTPLIERAQNIFREYVQEPLASFGPEITRQALISSLEGIQKKLGGLLFAQLKSQITEAFEIDANRFDLNQNWIESLLINYYDKLYTHSFQSQNREVIFEGQLGECKQWILENYGYK